MIRLSHHLMGEAVLPTRALRRWWIQTTKEEYESPVLLGVEKGG